MILTKPTMEYARQIRIYRQEFLDCGDSMDGTSSLRRFEDPADWIAHLEAAANPDPALDGRAPGAQFLFVREEDCKIVGMIDVRYGFNPYLEQFGGLVGYSVSPSERRKGYASQMLGAVLPLFRERGIERVLVTCDQGNEGSRKTILRNGGVYESTVFEPDERVYVERYWISLNSGSLGANQTAGKACPCTRR